MRYQKLSSMDSITITYACIYILLGCVCCILENVVSMLPFEIDESGETRVAIDLYVDSNLSSLDSIARQRDTRYIYIFPHMFLFYYAYPLNRDSRNMQGRPALRDSGRLPELGYASEKSSGTSTQGQLRKTRLR